MRALALALAVFLIAAPSVSWAEIGRCLIEVDGEPYVLGRCNIDIEDDGRDVTVGGGPKGVASPYFAMLSTTDGKKWLADWNQYSGSTHAHTSLGEMTKAGACWTNDRARICAWPPTAKGPAQGLMYRPPR